MLACTGNHDFFAGVDEVERHARSAGVRLLRNEGVEVGDGLVVYGVDDPTGARMGLSGPARIEDVVDDGARARPSVLLHHQPVGFEKAASLGVGLMLSGHTHHGQLWPLGCVSTLIYPRNHGRFALGASTLYVTAGIGTWGPPMRVGAAPEIVLVRLHP